MLSRCDEEGKQVCDISSPPLHLFDLIRDEIKEYLALEHLMSRITKGELADEWMLRDGLIFYSKKVYVEPTSHLCSTIITALREHFHKGYQNTLHHVS